MKLLVINPNTTASMTAKIGAAARSVASPGTQIEAVNPAMGPVSIEGFYDEALCLPGLLTEVAAGERRGADAIVVACFDDPGIDAARSIASVPVLGICEAAMRMASMLGHRFTIVTTQAISLPAMEGLIRRHGMEACGRARAAGVPVLALEDPLSGAVAKVRTEIHRAVTEDRAECILLGCAGMADLARDLTGGDGAAGHRRRGGGGQACGGGGRARATHVQGWRLRASGGEVLYGHIDGVRALSS